jgi:isopentenyldiphosphate isomerase/intracellular septation protein A
MNPTLLLKSLLPGLLPLIAYVGSDAIFGETIGLIVGVGLGLAEFAYILIKDRKADPFVAADTLLLCVAGGVSLLVGNDIFFKLKPAIIELILALAMVAMLALPPAYLKGYLARQLRGISIPDAALPAMKRSLAILAVLIGAHVALTTYAALALSKGLWGFVSGGLLYILFGAYALWQLASAKLRSRRISTNASGEEMLPLVDESGKVLGSAPRSVCHKGPGMLHPVVHLQIVDGMGGMYLQKRSASKDLLPGMWDSAVGGHVSAGEDLDTALSRELREELGVTSLALDAAGARIEPILRYKWESELESELVFSFIVTYQGPFAPDGVEVDEGRFWSLEEIRSSLGKGLLTPNFEHEFGLIERAAAEAAAAAARGTDSRAQGSGHAATSTGSSSVTAAGGFRSEGETKKNKRG